MTSRDKTHEDFIERWADYVYSTRKSREWKKQHREFINSQINMANRALFRIAKVKGIDVIRELRKISNEKALEIYKRS